MHHQARWFAFHQLAVAPGALTSSDVFMSVLPAPFGFGLWTAHFTPTLLGAPCVLPHRFTPDAALAAIEAHRVTVLAAVSTQFVMMLNSPASGAHDLSSLRVLYTGGEMVPYARAAEFEERTGARVLQFYGSNETGALSATSVDDDRDTRLRTGGHVIPSMQVRLLDPDTGTDITATGGPGVAACRGDTELAEAHAAVTPGEVRLSPGSPKLAMIGIDTVRAVSERVIATLPALVVPNEDQTVRVVTPVTGRIEALLAQPGDHVAAGQPPIGRHRVLTGPEATLH